MEITQFAREIDNARDRAARLWQRFQAAVAEPTDLVMEVTEELRNALEDLQVAQEELRMQNEQLIATRVTSETQIQEYRNLFELASQSYVEQTEERIEQRIQELEHQREATNEEIAQLKAADHRKDEFLARLSHELRNKLTPILTATQVLHERPADLAVVEWSHGMIERQVRQMTQLVYDLLDVSRIACGNMQLCLEWVNLATMVARAIETTRSHLEARGHQLTVSGLDAPFWLQADATRLEQVFSNLLQNAAKYTEVNGKIWVDVERDGDHAVICVRDTGIGMTPEFLKQLFDPFVQADRSQMRSQGGLGIGLALVRKLVEMHGGTVAAQSAGPGQGSAFTVRLPGAVERPEKVSANAPAKPKGCAARILAVDDNADAAQSLALLLRAWGHEVTVASDGATALAAAAEHPPDIALLDIGLPGMDGYQLAQQLRNLPGLEKAVLIAITGYGQEQDRRLSEQAGFKHHLVKPVDLDALQSLLADASTNASV